MLYHLFKEEDRSVYVYSTKIDAEREVERETRIPYETARPHPAVPEVDKVDFSDVGLGSYSMPHTRFVLSKTYT